ncbi:MAG: hypothetical protein GY832_19470 [Chloroflexi bacterium]|nr:hypothetical protein [Chloroflexota bacterium]
MSPTSIFRRRVILGAGIVYALAVGLMTLPVSLQLSQRLIGNNIDNWIFYWNNWWLERAITEGQNWFTTPNLFYPQGADLVAHSNSFLNSLLAMPLKPLVGPVAAYNLVLLFGLWVGAVGMFLFVYDDVRHVPAALLAGFIFSFAPYHLTQLLAHAHLGSIHWWPWYALFLRRALREKRTIDALLAGLFAALTLWTGLQLAVLLALWTVVYIGARLLRERQSWQHVIRTVNLIGIVTLILSAPLLIPIAQNWEELAAGTIAFDEGLTNQTDILAYLLPPTYHPLAGSRISSVYERFVANKAAMPYLGYTALVLATISILSRRKTALFWLLNAGLWITLAAGSALRINGHLYPQIPLPYRFIGRIFPIAAIRAPDRFNLLLVFSLAVSAGLGAAYLAKRYRWLLIPLALLLIAEYASIPLPAWDLPAVSPFLERMAADAQKETTYGVIDYPMGYTISKQWLYFQTIHGKPMVEGHISRYTIQDYAFIASHPLLRALYQKADKPIRLPQDTFDDQTGDVYALGPALRSLETAGMRYILLHKPYLDSDLQAHFRRVLPILPIYQDTTLAVYDVTHPLPTSYDDLPAPLTPDVALARFDVQHDNAEWQFQTIAAALAPRISPHTCNIQLVGEQGAVLSLPITLFKELPGGATWETNDLQVKQTTVELVQELEPGPYHWAITCSKMTTYAAPDTLHVHANGHTTYLRHPANIHYGETIEFQGYRWRTVGTELEITLRWQALEQPTTNYKVFVHLLNAGNKIIHQHDAIPCNWQCPTIQWHAGETIPDQATIPLAGLAPGEYRLAIGLYDAETLQRLPTQNSDGARIPDDYFILPDTFVISTWDDKQ